MDDESAIAALLGLPAAEQVLLAATELANQGLTVTEIAAQLRLSPAAVALQVDEITPAQLKRIAHVMVDRAVGVNDLAPHVQAAQFILANHLPEQYGRQAQQASATLRVIVDRDWTKRASLVHEGELVPVLPPPPLG